MEEKRLSANIKIIDPAANSNWDDFVVRHPFGWLYHLSGWKRVLDKSFSHMKGYYFGLFDGEAKIQAGLPVYEVKSYLTGRRLVSIPFATLFDPLVSNNEEFGQLFKAVLDRFKNGQKSMVEIRSQHSPALIKNERLSCTRVFKHHYLDLCNPPEVLKKKFHRSCIRQRIARAEKSNLRVKTGADESDLQNYYRLHMRTRKNVGRPTQPYRFFKAIWDTFYPVGQLTLLLAEKDGTTIAGMLLLKFKDRVSAEFAASDERCRNLSPNHFLFWESIKLAHREGYHVFDFGRTSLANKPLMDFKGRWGAEVVDLPMFYYPDNKIKENAAGVESRSYRLMSQVCHKAPDYLQPFIGNFCYRHLG